MINRCNNCGNNHEVRIADYKRGWGRFCDKSCAATFKSKMIYYIVERSRVVRMVKRLIKC